VRAICQLPLGMTDMTVPNATMVNVLGDCWYLDRPPDWASLLNDYPSGYVHFYGKAQARPGRKMAHINVLTTENTHARETACALNARLYSPV
jgi:5-(carboxyamino)imidazole ribonucleotide synthase